MARRAYVDAPFPLFDVLDAALASLDGRFKQVPNGHIDIAWRQPRKTKGDETTARYFFGVEFAYAPSASSPTQRLSACIEEYLVSKYGSPPVIPATEQADVNLDLWLAVHGDVAAAALSRDEPHKSGKP